MNLFAFNTAEKLDYNKLKSLKLTKLKDVDEGGDEGSGEGSEEGDFKLLEGFCFKTEKIPLTSKPLILK